MRTIIITGTVCVKCVPDGYIVEIDGWRSKLALTILIILGSLLFSIVIPPLVMTLMAVILVFFIWHMIKSRELFIKNGYLIKYIKHQPSTKHLEGKDHVVIKTPTGHFYHIMSQVDQLESMRALCPPLKHGAKTGQSKSLKLDSPNSCKEPARKTGQAHLE